MPDKMSKEKIDLLRAYGAEVVVAPTDVPPESPESYYRVADRLTEEIPGAFQPNQYRNPANPEVHYRTTGPELWRQSGGQITHLVVGVGTGGTITGVGRYLREQNPAIEIIGADPVGSIYSGGEDGVKPYLVEGVGEDFWPETYDPSIVDRYVTVSDQDSFLWTRKLAESGGHPRRRLLRAGAVRRPPGGARDRRPRRDGRGDLPRRRALLSLEDLQRRLDAPVRLPRARGGADRRRRAAPQARRRRDPAAPHRGRSREGSGRRRRSCTSTGSRSCPWCRRTIRRRSSARSPSAGCCGTPWMTPALLGAEIVEVIEPPFPAVSADDGVREAVELLTDRREALLVNMDGRAAGILTRADLLESLAR